MSEANEIGFEGQYQLVRVIARGSHTTIFEAIHTILENRREAIKVLENVDCGEYRTAFMRSVKVATSLQHSGIVPVYSVGEANNEMFMTMALVSGGNLWGQIGHGRKWPATEAVEFVHKLAGALDYAHQNGVIHGYLHPKHILLTDDMLPQLIGFGEYPLPSNEIPGNPIHLAPEQFGAGGQATAQTDVFALAETVFCMLAGTHPYYDTSVGELLTVKMKGPVQSLPESLGELHLAIDAVLKRGMSPKPEDRFNSAGAFSAAFELAILGKKYRREPTKADATSACQC